ncbi:FAD/NAD(P)-binding oxidoreductase [Roseateles flavus]|uniref:FAD/NAD(P)-binding oxidoreductase n=1 Tax=Roseateles flavus TaxID=3149041 RepID=A0ABV0G9E4_9BURK
MSSFQAPHLVIGSGPAGLAAVQTLLKADAEVLWLDNQAQAGGQIWRGGPAAQDAQARRLAPVLPQLLASPRLRFLPGHMAVGTTPEGGILAQDMSGGRLKQLRGDKTLLALGARELHVPVPGWDLPGVTGAGGLQALVKGGWPVAGKRMMLAGSGPLLLATAKTLQEAGATLSGIIELRAWQDLTLFASRLNLAQWQQALALRWQLRRVPYRIGVQVVRVLGQSRVEGVRLSDGLREWDEPCEALGLGFGLLPNSELAAMLGCDTGPDGRIVVDTGLLSSRPGVYAAGECTGIGGMGKAWIEGQLAALSMLGKDIPGALTRAHAGALAFSQRLARHFGPTPAQWARCTPEVRVCRCEGVRLRELQPHPGWREAKLQTRCGMGACQGRICGPISQQLLGWPEAHPQRGVRFPLQPLPIASLLDER